MANRTRMKWILLIVSSIPLGTKAQNESKNFDSGKINAENKIDNTHTKSLSNVLLLTDGTIINDPLVTGDANSDFKKLTDLEGQGIGFLSLKSKNGKLYSYGEARLNREIIMTKHREYGLKLWKRYPNDARRYDWFKSTIFSGGRILYHYWQNINAGNAAFHSRPSVSGSYNSLINWNSLYNWENLYPEMRRNYFSHLLGKAKSERDTLDIKKYRFVFDLLELESFLMMSLNASYRNVDRNNKINIGKLEQLIIQAGFIMGMSDSAKMGGTYVFSYKNDFKRTMDNDFLSCYNTFGLTDKDLNHLINKLIASTNKGLKEWGIQRRTLLKLKDTPFALKAPSLDGRLIDIENMRGKVILVDFWSVWCSSCIERMPAIKNLYKKYKDDGFEVISACFNDEDKLEEVKRIEEKISGGWPTLLIGGSNKESLGYSLLRKYGFFGVPQLLLLDKTGKLVMLNDILRDGDFEPLLVNLLKSNQ